VAALAGAVAALAAGGQAAADGPALREAHSARFEVQDTAGGPAPLDIREVDSDPDAASLGFTIVTWSRWGTRSVRDRDSLLVFLDTLPVPGFDYYVLLRSNGHRIRGVLLRASERKRDRRLARVRSWRSDRRSVSFRLPRRKLQLMGPPRLYAWYAETLVTSRRCKRVCFDRAPDMGAAQETVPPG
jgi:hypothetical protein